MFYTFFSKIKLSRKYFYIIILLCFLITGRKTEAFPWPQWVLDPANFVQNTVVAVAEPVEAFGTQPITAASTLSTQITTNILDGIAYQAAQSILKGITAQTVNWINNGFKGNPAFITNPERFFQNQADLQLERVLGNQLNGLCKPFALQVRIALITNYLDQQKPPACTIDRIIDNYENFGKDTSRGYWQKWFEYTQNDSNNPYGAYNQSTDFVKTQITSSQTKKNKELDWGRGFLSFNKCISRAGSTDISGQSGVDEDSELNSSSGRSAATGTEKQICVKIHPFGSPPLAQPMPDGGVKIINPGDCLEYKTTRTDENGTDLDVDEEGNTVSDGLCLKEETVTPGSVIENQLQKVLGSSVTKLELADRINEIVSAVMQQMFKKALGASINGLRGLSKKQPNERKSMLEEILSKDRDSLGTQEDIKNLQRIDNSIPPAVEEFIRPATNANGERTFEMQDVSRTRPGQYVDPSEIENIVDSEINRTNAKYSGSGAFGNNQQTCDPNTDPNCSVGANPATP